MLDLPLTPNAAVCHHYLIERQKLNISQMIPSSTCILKDIVISGTSVEGEDITVDFIFGCEEHIHRSDADSGLSGLLTGTMEYQWYRGTRGGFFTLIPNTPKNVSTYEHVHDSLFTICRYILQLQWTLAVA